MFVSLVPKPEGKRPLGSPKSKSDGNIKIGRTEVGWEYVNRISLTQDRSQWRACVNTVIRRLVTKRG